ncbi:MAG TPA: lipid II flippase MurJ, partial [Propionibacteriaceae bacterium]
TFMGVFDRTNPSTAFSDGQELLLGLGATLGIAVQAAVLLPFLKRAGYRFRPRFDFRHTGLGKTFNLAKWTLGFVLVTQVALVVVSKLATGATVDGRGAGLAVYYNAYAVWILPHSLITVSLATAMLPAASRLAAAGDLAGVAEETTRTIRLAVTALLPAAVGLVVLGVPVAQLAFGFGQGARDAIYVGWALMALAIGLVPFTIQYIVLRAFYALEDTRTPFFLQIVISGANVVLGIAVVLMLDRPSLVATGLAIAYAAAYLLGVLISFRRLRRRLPDLDSFELIRHCVRLFLAVAPAALAAWLICWAVMGLSSSRLALVGALVVSGLVAVVLFLVVAKFMGIREVTEIIATVTSRSGRGSSTATLEGPAERENDLATSGDSSTPIEPISLSIGEATAAAATQQPSGPTQNADLMAQAAVVRNHFDDDDHTVLTEAGALGDAPKAAALPAGTILASRYRLEELIAESGPTVTWRAFDQVLSRSVLVHLLAPGDPEEGDLLSAARRASVATDSRFLRVLDAVHSSDPDLGSYIVCEYATGQSLEVILSHGPLSGLEAAWVVREVADALSGVHSLGLYHRRINPDTVIITPTGNVKIVGLLIEAALRPIRSEVVHGADTPELVDVLDLGRLLYASIVARWPGGPAFSLPDAPSLGRRWMTPRQVRAGVSPALDNVCDQILGDPPRHKVPALTSANSVVNALTKVLGTADAAIDLERRLKQPIPKVGPSVHRPSLVSTAAPVSALLEQPTEPMEPIRPRTLPAAAVAPPTQVSTRVPVPPSSDRSMTGDTTVIRRIAAKPPRARQPQRWIGLLILLTVLLIAAAIVSGLVLNKRMAAAPEPSTSAPAPSASASASVPPPGPISIRGVRDFDPQANPRSENPGEVKFAWDGNDKTRWRTVQYIGNPKLGNLKRGVGLVVDLGTPQPVTSVKLTLSGNGTAVDLRVPKGDASQVTTPPMTTDKSWVSVAAESKAGSSVTLTPAQSVTTRYVLVYLTSLPKEGSGYRGGIYEVEVLR